MSDVFTALDEQTVVVPGTDAAALIVPSLASQLKSVLDQRKLLATRIEELLESHPLSAVLTSMPGIGVRTGARNLVDVGDGRSFPTAGHLAAYAGLAPATRSSGSSIRGEQPSRRGNKQLKRAALAVSLTEKEVHEGKTPNADALNDEALDCRRPSGTGRAHPVGPGLSGDRLCRRRRLTGRGPAVTPSGPDGKPGCPALAVMRAPRALQATVARTHRPLTITRLVLSRRTEPVIVGSPLAK